jgi:hypothetical protein
MGENSNDEPADYESRSQFLSSEVQVTQPVSLRGPGLLCATVSYARLPAIYQVGDTTILN